MNKIQKILEFSDTNGTIPTLTKLNNEINELEKLKYLINVIDFCDILKILVQYTLPNNVKLKFNFIKKENFINIKNELYNPEAEVMSNRIINLKKNRNLKQIYYGINTMLEKFQNVPIEFFNENNINEEIEISLNLNNLEVLKEYFLSRELFNSYQAYYLKKHLLNNKLDETVNKI